MRILVAVDESPCSQLAVDAVADRSWPEKTQFKLLSVVEPLTAEYGFAGAYGVDTVIQVQKQLIEHRRSALQEMSKRLAKLFGEGRVSSQVNEGFPAECILDEAKEWSADLIVVGSHGRKGIQKFLLGSVAERVVCNSPCSVEVVKTKTVCRECKDTREKEVSVADLIKTGRKA